VPLIDYEPYRDAHYRLLRLWTKAKGSEGYDKSEWQQLEQAIERLAGIAKGRDEE
jgi:hypothetical protein